MDSFYELIQKIYPLSEEAYIVLYDAMTAIECERGGTILNKGDINTYVYFVERGLTRSYVLRDGKDFTVWFSREGEPVVMTIGSIAQTYSSVCVEALEKTTLLRIEREKLKRLFLTNLELCNWGRRLADCYLCELEVILSRDLCSSASERYCHLLQESPELLQRVSLKHLASYLLITPESLSRIRRNIMK